MTDDKELKVYYRDLYEKAEAERDEWKAEAEDNARRETTQRNRADAWEVRYEALRADVEETVRDDFNGEPVWDMEAILDRDDERGEQA